MFGKRFLTTLLGFLQKIGSIRGFSRKFRTHDYTSYKLGKHYTFDQIHDGFQAYMTAYGRNVKRGDYILIFHNGVKKRYKVEQIDYYSNPSNMWIAQLTKDY